MADEFVELDEEGRPTGRKFGGEGNGTKGMDEFEEVSEADLEFETRAKEAAKRGAKKVRKGARRGFGVAREVSGRAMDEIDNLEIDEPREDMGDDMGGGRRQPDLGDALLGDVGKGDGSGEDMLGGFGDGDMGDATDLPEPDFDDDGIL